MLAKFPCVASVAVDDSSGAIETYLFTNVFCVTEVQHLLLGSKSRQKVALQRNRKELATRKLRAQIQELKAKQVERWQTAGFLPKDISAIVISLES